VVLTLPVKVVVPPASVVKLVSGVFAPIVELKSVAPVLSAISACAPSTAPVKVILPEPVLTMRSPLRVVVPPTVTALFVVASVLVAAMVTASP